MSGFSFAGTSPRRTEPKRSRPAAVGLLLFDFLNDLRRGFMN
ncbi:hypothetical protein [Paenibacillus sp. Soil724D2]|nr:hypothetical protein [Paenibacillus sp. Soil724D2]